MYAGYQLIFCDPLEHHSKPVRTTQKEITLDYAKGQADLGHVLVPGKKICFGDFNKKDKAIDSFCIESDDEAYCNEEDAYDECNVAFNSYPDHPPPGHPRAFAQKIFPAPGHLTVNLFPAPGAFDKPRDIQNVYSIYCIGA